MCTPGAGGNSSSFGGGKNALPKEREGASKEAKASRSPFADSILADFPEIDRWRQKIDTAIDSRYYHLFRESRRQIPE